MNRRIKRLNISPNHILNLFAEPKYILDDNDILYINNYYIEGLPKDAKVVGVTYDLWCHSVSLFIHSESFEEIPEYQTVPTLEIETKIIKKIGKYRKDEPYVPLF